jgi:acyl-CoA synthetase (AMP-forming)/AMP-acid ligase II
MLANFFYSSDHDYRIFLSDEGWVSGSTLFHWLRSEALHDWKSRFHGQTVGVRVNNQYALARTLLALDGVAKSIFLVPAALNTLGLEDYRDRIEVEACVTDISADVTDEVNVAAPPSEIDGRLPPRLKRQLAPLTTTWILATSGTTRKPKLVSHTLSSLARFVHKRKPSSKRSRWALLYDLNRFAGLQVFFQAICGEDELFIPPSTSDTTQLIDEIVKAQCTCLSATPTLWRKLLMHPGSKSLNLEQITLGGEISDQPILDALKSSYPDARITHIYASTEAGAGFSVKDGMEGFPAEFLQSEVKGSALRISEAGILEIRPESCEQNYIGEPETLLQPNGFISTGDRVALQGSRVIFLGRESGAINVGGNKVHPEMVERVLLAHPKVLAAKVSGRKSSFLGALVQASIVVAPNNSTPDITTELRTWCSQQLQRHEVPAFLEIVTDLDTEASGKLSRRTTDDSK